MTCMNDPKRSGQLCYASSSHFSCLQSAPSDATPLNIVDFLPQQTPNPELSRFLNNPALGRAPCSWEGFAGRCKALS